MPDTATTIDLTGTAIDHIPGYTTVVGESPIWCEREQRLYWIDPFEKKMLRARAPFSETEIRSLHYRPSSFAMLPNGGFLIAYKKGIGTYDFDSDTARPLPLTGIDFSVVSFNDGACDKAGRLWVGTRHRDASEPVGALFRIDPDLSVHRVVDGLTVSNGIAWSPDSRTMYLADSRPGRIHAYDFDVSSGSLSRPRVLIDYVGKGRRPDGCTVDAEGFLWVAEIDGWRVSRYAPDGALEREILLPVRKPASVIFGGDDMATLFVTSITYGLTEEERAAQPLAGKVMMLRPGVRGLPENCFGASP